MSVKRITPYERLLRAARHFAFDVTNPKWKPMWTYPKRHVDEGFSWKLQDLIQRVLAAEQLGYSVRLRVNEGGLHVEYVKRPEVPPELL